MKDHSKDFIYKNNIFINKKDCYDDFVDYTNPLIGSWGVPNKIAEVEKFKGPEALTYPNELVCSASYTLSEFGNRATVNSSTSEKVAIFFGDSLAFGEGVNDNETIPSYFNKLSPEYTCHNYGFPGHGFSHSLKVIETEHFQKKFQNKKGKVFLLCRDDAVKITSGKSVCIYRNPNFKLIDGRLNFKGFYQDTEYKDLYLASEFSDYDYKLTLAVLDYIRIKLKKISTELEINIVIHPLTFSSFKLEEILKKAYYKVYNFHLTDLEYLSRGVTRLLDSHNGPVGNKLIAFLLSKYINEYSDIYNLELEGNGKLLFKLGSFMIPHFLDFPEDDVALNIDLCQYGTFQEAEDLWGAKKDLVKKLQEEELIPPNYIRDWIFDKEVNTKHLNAHLKVSFNSLLKTYPLFQKYPTILKIFFKEYIERLKNNAIFI